jgi:hypothetical protein
MKANQNWLKKKGEKFLFPGGGTMFPNGVGEYIDNMEELIPGMKDGTVRTALDTGCGVRIKLSHCSGRLPCTCQQMVPQLSVTPLMLLTIGCQAMLTVCMPFMPFFNRQLDLICVWLGMDLRLGLKKKCVQKRLDYLLNSC